MTGLIAVFVLGFIVGVFIVWMMEELRGPNHHHQLLPHQQGQNNVASAG